MASFSVDITDIIFAGGRTGSKVVTISNAPSGGIGISNTGYGTHFRVVVQEENVSYSIETKAKNTSGESYSSYIRFYNKEDSSDYVDIPIVQYSLTEIGLYADNLTYNTSIRYDLDIDDYHSGSTDLYIDINGGIGTIQVTKGEGWLSVTEASPVVTDTGFVHYIISYTDNTVAVKREGSIKFNENLSTNEPMRVIFVTQVGGGAPALTATPSSKKISSAAGTVAITVTGAGESDISYSIAGSWITFDHKSGDDYYFNYEYNDGDLERIGIITFSATGYLSVKCELNQTISISFSPTSKSVDSSAGTVPIIFNNPQYPSNYNFSYDISDSWITFDHISGSIIYFNYTANTGSSRTGVITFLESSFDTKSFTLTQDGGAPAASISVSPSSLSFGADASYADISLTYGGTYYNTDAAEVHTWVTVNISDTETGKASGTVAVASNTSTESRSGNVYFSDELGASIALPIEQAGISFALSANPSTLNIPASGGSVTTAVTYEGTLSAASLPSWLSETHTDNDANHRTYTVTAASNGPTQERTFNWKLDDDYNNMYVFISQAAAEVPSMVISPTSSSVGGSSGTVDITVRSTNISDISYSISDSWITYSSKSGSVYTFSYEANTTTSQRQGTITFSGGGISQTFTLTQECISTDSITVNKNVLSVVNGGGYFRDYLKVTYTGKVTVQSSLFITGVSSFSSTGTYKYSFSVSGNTETESSKLRRGTIKFIGDNGTSCEVVVYQGGKTYGKRPVCMPDYTLGTYPAEGGQKYLAIDYYERLTYTGVPSWITLNIVAGGTGETDSIDDISPVVFSVYASRNNSSSSRKGTMVFQGGDSLTLKNSNIAVSQEGKGGSNPLSVSPTELSFTVSGGTKSVTVSGGTGTIAVNTGSFPSWLSIASVSNGVYNITASENSGASRSFDVWFTDEAFTTVIVNVSQDASSVELTVSPSSKRFGSEGGSQVFRVTYNTRINYNTLPSWLSIASDTTTGSTIEYTMTASENTDTSSRNFNWVLTDELTSVTVPISQSGASGPGPEPEPVEEGSLKVYPEKLRYYSDGGRILVSFTNRPEAGIGYSITYTDGSGWLSVEGVSPNMYVSATANDGIRRRAEIKFYDLSDNTNYVIVPVIQGSVEGYTSIWMDDLYYPENRDASGNYFYKVVNQDTEQIYFMGISSKPLSWSGNIGGIDIPRLVDNYIKSDFVQQNIGEDWADMYSGYCTVDVYNMANTDSVVDATFKYWNDWSRFERKYDYTRSLNDPINGKGCDNMIIPFCVYYDDEATFTIVDTAKNGNINTYTLSSPSSPFMMRYNSYYDIKKLEYKQDNDILFSYDMNHCGPGAFIYRNRFGGWDSFLIEGNISKTDNYTKQNYRIKGEYNQEYVINTLKYIDEKRTDSIDIDTTYEASTGWLTDEESERLVFHLLSSPIVYFQNLHKENQLYDTDSNFDIIPVRITASSSEYKKFRNGRRLVNYLITFEKCNIEKVRQ